MKTVCYHYSFVLVLATLVATGCSIYHPQSVDIPLINHEGDSRVDVSASLSATVFPDVLTVGATYSYGINDWVAAQAHVNYGGENVYGQLAPGAYLPLGEHGLLEGYAGMGFGGVWMSKPAQEFSFDTASQYQYLCRGSFLLPFVQANIGVHDVGGVHFDAAVGLKAGAYLPAMDYLRYLDGELLEGQGYRYSTANFLFEPQLMLRLGGERTRWNLRVSYAWLSDMMQGGGNRFIYDLFTVSTGLTFAF